MQTYADDLAAQKTSDTAQDYKNLALLGDAAQLEGARSDKQFAAGVDIYIAKLNAQAKVQAANIRKNLAANYGITLPPALLKVLDDRAADARKQINYVTATPEVRALMEKNIMNDYLNGMHDVAANALKNGFYNTEKAPAETPE
jgi:hypothetical protein